MGKNGLKMGVWLSFFYKFAENKEFLIGRFLPYKLGIETPVTEPVCGQENLCTHCVRSSTSLYNCLKGLKANVKRCENFYDG